MVIQLAGSAALGAGPSGEVFMGQIDMDFLGRQLQVYEASRQGCWMQRMRR